MLYGREGQPDADVRLEHTLYMHPPPLPTPFPYKYNKNKCRFSYGRGFFSAKPVTLKRLSSELSIDEKNKTLS